MSAPAGNLGSIATRLGVELRLTARRAENLLAMLVIPVAVLVFFVWLGIPATAAEPVVFLVPGARARHRRERAGQPRYRDRVRAALRRAQASVGRRSPAPS